MDKTAAPTPDTDTHNDNATSPNNPPSAPVGLEYSWRNSAQYEYPTEWSAQLPATASGGSMTSQQAPHDQYAPPSQLQPPSYASPPPPYPAASAAASAYPPASAYPSAAASVPYATAYESASIRPGQPVAYQSPPYQPPYPYPYPYPYPSPPRPEAPPGQVMSNNIPVSVPYAHHAHDHGHAHANQHTAPVSHTDVQLAETSSQYERSGASAGAAVRGGRGGETVRGGGGGGGGAGAAGASSMSSNSSNSTTSSSSSVSPPKLKPTPVQSPPSGDRSGPPLGSQLQSDGKGRALLRIRPDPIMRLFMCPFPFMCIGCCLSESSNIDFDDVTETVSVNTYCGYCFCCAGTRVLPYGGIGNITMKASNLSINGQQAYKLCFVLKNGERIEFGGSRLPSDVRPQLFAIHYHLYGRAEPDAYRAPSPFALTIR